MQHVEQDKVNKMCGGVQLCTVEAGSQVSHRRLVQDTAGAYMGP